MPEVKPTPIDVDNITILDLIKVTEWNDVRRAMAHYYPGYEKKMKPRYERVASFKPIKCDEPGEVLEIHAGMSFGWLRDKDNLAGLNTKLRDLVTQQYSSLKNIKDHVYYSMATNKYSMSFRSWRKLASIPISLDTLDHYTFEDILAHFLWEITFYGDEKQTQKKGKELLGRMKDAMKMKDSMKKK